MPETASATRPPPAGHRLRLGWIGPLCGSSLRLPGSRDHNSQEQFSYAQRWCRGLDVEIQLRDYREITEQFDRVVSVGMVEHVGYKNYRTYIRAAACSLGDDGLFLCQGICGNFSRVHTDPWIKRYIFPNSMLPSIAQLTRAAKAFSSLKTSRTSARITTRHSSPGRKTSAAPGLVLQIATASVSGECGDFICSVARAHFGRAVCRSFRFCFRKKYRHRNAHGSSRAKCTHLKSRVKC